MTAVLTNAGRAAIAAAIKSQPIHLAWGTGDPAWDDSPVLPPPGSTALVAELGRRAVSQAQFCLPAPNGEIDIASGRFTVSADPTKYLYLRFSFDFADEPFSTIREVGVFVGTVVANTVPPGQMYITGADIEDPGQMFTLERFRIERSPLIRQRFEFVLQF